MLEFLAAKPRAASSEDLSRMVDGFSTPPSIPNKAGSMESISVQLMGTFSPSSSRPGQTTGQISSGAHWRTAHA